MGNSYLWSEAHNLSNLLSVNSKVGNFKSFVCYPSHPSSRPFRCCLSVKNISLTSSGWLKNNIAVDDVKKHYIHHLILSAPLIINNYLPKEILLLSESGGVDHTVRVSEVCDCALFYFICLFIYVCLCVLHCSLQWCNGLKILCFF